MLQLNRSFQTSGTYDHEVGSSHTKRFRNVETFEEALLPDVHHEFLEWSGFSREAKSRYNTRLATLLPKLIYAPQVELAVMAFNIREPIYPELCRKFYATYEFDEVCVDDELQLKKIISFRLGGRAHNLTLLEFARRLGLYHADELDKEGARSQKDSQICCGQFISKIVGKSRVLTNETICTLSTPVYCRDLDRTTLRELIDSEDRLIPEILVDDVPRVAAQRAPRGQRA
ncbi:hypothetical protein Tco_1301685 [Tanacetum coccineum]